MGCASVLGACGAFAASLSFFGAGAATGAAFASGACFSAWGAFAATAAPSLRAADVRDDLRAGAGFGASAEGLPAAATLPAPLRAEVRLGAPSCPDFCAAI
ncbi:MAG: hypothetical protein DUD33_07930 [Coriobacteriaceae bacterium]|jgi:hypothetical protein|nr:MAG: hypothetical protein DUD33_07930 [Coriobacteriaceae bacterium]